MTLQQRTLAAFVEFLERDPKLFGENDIARIKYIEAEGCLYAGS